MKHLYLIATLTLITVSSFSQNYIYTAIKSGNFSATGNWKSALRADGKKVDEYIIPKGLSMTVNANTTFTNDVEIEISGLLELIYDKSLTLTKNSKITLTGGIVDIDETAKKNKKKKKEQIVIGDVVKYDGSEEDAITGNLIANQMTGASPFGFSINATLPVNFVSFNANKVNDAMVAISWSTSDEVNNSHFEIERSVDGINWSAIALMFPDENSANVHMYKYNDKYSVKGNVYYRIRQVDMDGKEKYSSVKLIGGVKSDLATLIYVSSKKTVTVDLKNASESNIMVRLVTMSGVIVSQKLNNQAGEKIFLTAYNAAPGAYIVQVTNMNGMFSAKKVLL